MRATFIALALAAAVIAGCGGDNNESSATPTPEATQQSSSGGGGGGGGKAVNVSAPADGSLKFDQSKLSAKAGKVTFKFANPSSVAHAFEVEGNGVEEETKTITNGDASVTVNLKPGKYEYYCPVDGHRAAGMEGTLTVQ
jgi:plastocyanin